MRAGLFALALVCAVAACGQTPASEEGQYGASSGPNPNLADIQAETPADPSREPMVEPPVVNQPQDRGGRSSAATGATEDPAAADAAGGDAKGTN